MSRSTNKRQSKSQSGLGTLIVLGALIVFGIIFASTGADPLGLFAVETITPGSAEVNVPPTTAPQTPSGQNDAPVAGSDWYEVGFVEPIRVRAAEEVEYGENGIPDEILEGSLAENLIQRIDQAEKSILIASFETDMIDIADALIRAHKRGVDVRWITDDEFGIESDEKPGHGQFAVMEKAGIEIIDDQRSGLMHNKFWIFDSQTVWTGSTNVTISGMFEQDNNVIVIESAELAAIYEKQFEEMWAGEFGARSPSDVEGQKLNVNGTPIEVLFSPEDKPIEHIVPYIQNARRNIRFLAFSYTHPDLGNAMVERMENGVTIHGVFEKVGSDTEYSEMLLLYCAGGNMRQDTNFAFLHHKVIIVDNRYVITGSLNFSDSANTKNNENVIIIDNREIASLYLQEFERIWKISEDLDADQYECP